jgi:hypothetical protein
MEREGNAMSVTKTFRNLKQDAGRFDKKAFAKDSTEDNFKDEYGFVPESETGRYNKVKASYAAQKPMNPVTWAEKVYEANPNDSYPLTSKSYPIARKKSEVSNYSNKVYGRRKFSVMKATNAIQKKSMRAGKKVITVNAEVIEPEQKSVTTQKLRSDRLAKKEFRAAEMKSRLKRLQKAERTQAKVQRKLSAILRKRAPEQVNDRLYAGYSGYTPQKGILNTPNLFTQADGRTNAVRSGNILDTPNMLMQTKGKQERKRWF